MLFIINYKKYNTENMTFQKIADELNYERTTVSKKLDKYTKNIE